MTVVVVRVRVTTPLDVLLALEVNEAVAGRLTSLVGSLMPMEANT